MKIYRDLCKGCGICIEFCPLNVLKWSKVANKKGYLTPELRNVEKCSNCGICELTCPDFAIVVVKTHACHIPGIGNRL